jgi:hypothetical protein
MAEVYTGKVLIPGDQINAYLAARQAAAEARAPFRAVGGAERRIRRRPGHAV